MPSRRASQRSGPKTDTRFSCLRMPQLTGYLIEVCLFSEMGTRLFEPESDILFHTGITNGFDPVVITYPGFPARLPTYYHLFPVSRVSAWLFVPYILRIAFATYLTIYILIHNYTLYFLLLRFECTGYISTMRPKGLYMLLFRKSNSFIKVHL